MRDMGADAQVYHGATAVNSGRCTVGNLGFDDMLLVFVVLKANVTPTFNVD